MNEVTQLLDAIEQGKRGAVEELLPLVYEELRSLARQKLAREPAGQTLQPTALVHEAYLRLVGPNSDQAPGQVNRPAYQRPQEFNNRRHFFAAAAEAMRRILVDHSRRKRTVKHGGGMERVAVDPDLLPLPEPREDLLALDEALDRLAVVDPRKAELVKLRYFAGMSMAEAAEVLGISLSSAEKYWTYAKAWLYSNLREQSSQAKRG
jgi:RNA polymerase sigma factor (TIGR02999 family)